MDPTDGCFDCGTIDQNHSPGCTAAVKTALAEIDQMNEEPHGSVVYLVEAVRNYLEDHEVDPPSHPAMLPKYVLQKRMRGGVWQRSGQNFIRLTAALEHRDLLNAEIAEMSIRDRTYAEILEYRIVDLDGHIMEYTNT